MLFCENCGSKITGNVCQKCGWNATKNVQHSQQYQQPHQQNPQSRRRSIAPIVGFVLIIIIAIIYALMYILIPPPPDIDPTPMGSFDFTETSPGNYTGGIIWLSGEVQLSQAIITINDVSAASVASQGPPLQSGVPITTSGGLSLTFTDMNSNNRIDPEDVWTISNAAEGDQIKWLHAATGSTIAMYTIP
jgi:hypothetical protein